MILARTSAMAWRVRMVLVAAGALAVTLLLVPADSPLTRERLTRDIPEQPSVRIEHELVRAAVIVEPVEKRPAVHRVRATVPRHTRPAGIASRARQLLVGDGRYKPEPFPRAGQ